MARIQITVNLKIMIECEENFDINNLGVCIVEEAPSGFKGGKEGFVDDDLLFLPRTDSCEIVDYVEIKEE